MVPIGRMEADGEDLICLEDDAYLRDVGEDEDFDLYNEETFALGTEPSHDMPDDLFLLCEALGAGPPEGLPPPLLGEPCPPEDSSLEPGSGSEGDQEGGGPPRAPEEEEEEEEVARDGAAHELNDPAVMTAIPRKPPLESLDSAVLDSGACSSWERMGISEVLGRALQQMNAKAPPYEGGSPPFLLGPQEPPRTLPGPPCLLSPGLESILLPPRPRLAAMATGAVPFGPFSPALSRPKPLQMRFGSPAPGAAFRSPSASVLEAFRFPRHVTQLHPQHHRLLSQKHQKLHSEAKALFDDHVDSYASLMTDREKAWVIKLQMIQLQSENPFLQDYYYQEFFRRLEAKMATAQIAGEREKQEPQKLVTPYVQKADNYDAVVHIEGSLGQVAVSTCYSPRRAIDAVHVTTAEGTVARDRLTLLYTIEKMFLALLEVEEMESRDEDLGEEERSGQTERRERTVRWLYESLRLGAGPAEEKAPKLCEMLSVRKGQKLVSRLLPLLPSSHALDVAVTVAGHLVLLIEADAYESLTVLFEPLSVLVRGLSFSQLVSVLQALARPGRGPPSPLQAVFRNKFAISYLYALLSHGEHLLTLGEPTDTSVGDHDKWMDAIFLVAKELSQAPKSGVAEPLHLPSNLLSLFCRYVDKTMAHRLEDRMESAPQLPKPPRADVLPV